MCWRASLLADDPVQFEAAARVLDGHQDCTAPLTVLLELVWVLEGYKLAPADIARGLRALLGLPHFKPLQPQVVAQALRWYDAGLDFADALHLAQCAGDAGFASFDTRLVKRVGKLVTQPQVQAPV